MNPKGIAKLRKSASDFDAISQKLFDLANKLNEQPNYNIYSTLDSINRQAETATMDIRNAIGRVAPEVRQSYNDGSNEALGISIAECNSWIKITLPGIVPHRNVRDNGAFLTRPMRNALIQYQRQHPMERFRECAICIVHQYDEALGVKRIHDYDNVETKRYLDVIESVFLTNDTGLLCTVLQATQIGDRDATFFYLMPPFRLKEWVENSGLWDT